MTLKEFVVKHRPTVFYFFSLLFTTICLSIRPITVYLLTIRSFFIYFFSFSYLPVYKVINYPLDVMNKFVQLPFLYEENVSLKKAVKELYITQLENKYLNEKINNFLSVEELKHVTQYKLLACELVTREYKEWFNECIVYIYEATESIPEDAPVVVYIPPNNFYLVGRVWSVQGKLAKILLITNSLSMIPVKVKNKPIYGVLIGNSSPNLSVDYILLEDDIRIGDVIVTAGINNIPEGIEIGYVNNISGLSSTGFKKVSVKLSYNINSIKSLLILVTR